MSAVGNILLESNPKLHMGAMAATKVKLFDRSMTKAKYLKGLFMI